MALPDYTIFTHRNGMRFAQLPNGKLVPNLGLYPVEPAKATDEDIAKNFARYQENVAKGNYG